ncbi:MAG: methyltransferase domain-containing protein [Chloroflexi bacterium]|nr:methyltransferase domain-containing protein [Chloroflexota bacterium]
MAWISSLMVSFLDLEAYLGGEYLHPGSRAATEILLRYLQIRPGEYVLEIGCGTGATAALVSRRIGTCVIGMDLSPVMLAASRVRQTVHLVQANGNHRLPFQDQVFDVLYAESVVALLDAPGLIHEAVRVLRPGGRLAFIERIWKPSVTPALAKEINTLSIRLFGIPAATDRIYDVKSWLDILRSAGLVDVQAVAVDAILPASPDKVSTLPRVLSRLCLRARRAWRYVCHPALLGRSLYYKNIIRQTTTYWSYLESYFFFGQKAGG